MRQILFGLFAVFSICATIIGVQADNQPDVLHIERSRTMKVEAEVLYDLAVDLEAYKTWDPWSEKDPDQKTTWSDETSGVGAWMAWEGNEDVGKGKMTIIEVVPNKKVVTRLEFFEPWEGVATSTLTIEPAAKAKKGNLVTWSMEQDQDFGAKLFGMFADMDSMLGPDFAHGLKNLAAKGKEVQASLAEQEALRQQLRDTMMRDLMAAPPAEGE
ncbi:MAG: hypothetical protein EP330_06810 [Deltaproteobacteria bacterium]|nr:MAG: hypothetical protein EP330_06810 [Deltaproteobacteria bacterium]